MKSGSFSFRLLSHAAMRHDRSILVAIVIMEEIDELMW